MKTCQNCRAVWGDDYAGTCLDCGAPLGNVPANGGPGMEARFARQISSGRSEGSMEQQMKRGNYDNVSIPQSVLDVAAGFVIFDPSKLPKEE